MSKNNHNSNQQKETTTTEEQNVEEVVDDKKEEVSEEKVVVNTPKKEEKNIEDLKNSTNKAGNTRVKEIDEEIKVLKAKLNKTFSAIQQVTYDEKIKLLKAEKAKILEKKLDSTNVSIAGDTMKDTSPVNNVIPAGRGVVLDNRTTTLSIGAGV